VGTYIIRRVLTGIPTLIVISIIIFAILKLAPGDPLSQFAANPAVPLEVRQNIRKQLGLDDPLPVQYSKWATSWARGDWGFSFSSRTDVRPLVAGRIGTTLYVMGLAFLVELLIAIPIGILSAVRQYSIFDQIATTIAFFGFSIPTFFSGLLAILLFSIKLNWFPFIYENQSSSFTLPPGPAPLAHLLGIWNWFTWGQLKFAILPVLVLGFFQGARLMRYVRASMLENIKLDYVRTARAKGLRERTVVNGHVLRNALIPVITIVALGLPGLFGGALITEQIFRVPGIGSLLIASINANDTPVVMSIVFIISILVVFFNLVADVIYGVLDPRIKYS
jgi:peptide/nickel transport system permease protein